MVCVHGVAGVEHGLLWYHPHPHRETEEQVYRGLAGMFIVDDAAAAELELPDTYVRLDSPVGGGSKMEA
jgi:FtsP/CotA-like multicopper oxidase with cupredoxin domain